MWGNSRVIGIPVFMDAKNLQAFVDKDLRHGSKKWDTETN
nr:MAG TPA: NOGCT domain protein [Caudoviricetes sp.]